jgi:hypothetical protein
MMLKLAVFFSDFKLDNVLWVVFLINKGFSFLYVAALESVFYLFYAIFKRFLTFEKISPKIFLTLSPFLMFVSYLFIYVFTSYFLLIIAFILLSFSYHTYDLSLKKLEKQQSTEEVKRPYFTTIFLALILSNFFGGFFANMSWRIFSISVIVVKLILIAISLSLAATFKVDKSIYLLQKSEKVDFSINKDVIKLALPKVLILSIFNFFYIFVVYRMRLNFISPYHMGLLYSIEVLISMIVLVYFYHFEALAGSYIGKIITAIAFFSLTTFIFKDSLIFIALGFIFMSVSKRLNESLLDLNAFYKLSPNDTLKYSVNGEFFSSIFSSVFILIFAAMYTFIGPMSLVYSVIVFSSIYFAVLIF